MFQRLVPTLIALALGLVAILWGLVALQGVFNAEREEALESVSNRRQALQQYATVALGRRLARELDDVRDAIATAGDPRSDPPGVFLRVGDTQLLPRLNVVQPGSSTEAIELYEALADPARNLEHDDPGAAWTVRLGLRDELLAALAQSSPVGVERTLDQMLLFRLRDDVPAHRDLPYTLAMLSLVVGQPVAARRLPETFWAELVRDGADHGGVRVDSMHSALLDAREAFTADEFTFLAEELHRLGAALGLDDDEFTTRARAPARAPVDVASLEGPSLAEAGRWYVVPEAEETVVGLEVEPEKELLAVAVDMREQGLLGEGDTLSFVDLPEGSVALTAIEVQMRSPQWAALRQQILERFQLKTGLNIALGVLVMGIGGLAILAQRRKHRLLELRSELVAAVSHELRTPLASMRLLAETLERRLQGDPRARDYPSRLVDDIDGMSVLVENFLSFNRLDKGRIAPRLEDVALDEVVETLASEASALGHSKVRVRTRGLESVSVRADPDLLRLLLSNLMRNAAQYNDNDSPQIEVVAESGPPLRILVRDNGRGIPQAERHRVFEEFYRGSGARTGVRARGSGLGLAICRRIMQVHGGTIRILDTEGAGTTFELEFA